MAVVPPWSLAESIERRILAVRVAVALVLALLAVVVLLAEPGIGGDVVVSRYEINLSVDGLVLNETITYRVQGGDYRMLYRAWSWPLTLRGGTGVVPLAIACPEGMIPYIVYHNGTARPLIPASEEVESDIRWRTDKAEARDELGCYSPGPIPPGEYTVWYSWRLLPPEDARQGDALVIPLAVEGKHLDYELLKGAVTGAGSLALAPATLNATLERESGAVILQVRGVDEEQGLHIALGPEGSQWVQAYGDRAELAARLEQALILAGVGGAVLVPILAVLLYRLRGREPPPTGAIPTGFPPETGEKPWVVNVLYHGEPGFASRHAITATILDLLARGVLRLERSPEGPVLVIPESAEGLDWYEELVLRMLREIAGGDRLPLREARRRAREAYWRVRRLVGELTTGERLRELAREAVEPGDRLFGILTLLFLALAIPVNLAVYKLLPLHDQNLAIKALLANLLAMGGSIAILSMPSHVLGRWRRGYLERYTAWMLYAENASKAPPTGDLRALAYMVALGREEEVKRVLEASPTPDTAPLLELLAAATAIATATTSSRSSGASGGGGGGGAGAR